MASWTFLLVACCLVSTKYCQDAQPDNSNCPPGFTADGYSCFAYIDHEMTWTDAEATCAALGGFLPEIYGASQNENLKAIATKHGGHAIWIGGEDLVMEKTWTWSHSGILVDEYNNWAPGQPDNSFDDGENCMELNVNLFGGQWNDAECDNHQRFICERIMNDNVVG